MIAGCSVAGGAGSFVVVAVVVAMAGAGSGGAAIFCWHILG